MMHLGQLACSGVGLVIIEATGVEAAGRISPGCLGLYDDRCESALSTALSHCRQHSSAALGIQLAHAGRKASTKPPWGDDAGGAIPPSEPSGWEVVAPDTEPNWRPNSATPTALDEAAMERIIACWVDATERANRVGLDLIEIHCAHGCEDVKHSLLLALLQSLNSQACSPAVCCYRQTYCRLSSLAANEATITQAHPSNVVQSFRYACSKLFVLRGRLKNRLAFALLSVCLHACPVLVGPTL